MKKITTYCLFALITIISVNLPSIAEDKPFITVASTTSTQNSGLFNHILPLYQAQSNIEVRVVAVGTGAAIRLAKKGDADVLLVHHTPSEIAFVEGGFGIKRFDLMYNDFVLVGPRSDPAGVNSSQNISTALKDIAKNQAIFTSRGDDSGTHKKELGLWRETDIRLNAETNAWYRETGSGMGATLNVASAMNAYTITDRATWLSFKNKGDLTVLFEGDKRMFNPYGVILVNPEKHPYVKTDLGQNFIDWLISDTGQEAIASFKVNDTQLFYPNPK